MSVNEKSLQNLERHKFKPGQSGNPSGRPKNLITKALQKVLAEVEEGDDPKQAAEEIARLLVDVSLGRSKATREQLTAIQICLDRLEGRPRQNVSVTLNTREATEGRAARLIEAVAAEKGETLTRREALTLLADEGDQTAAAILEDEEP